MQICYSADFGAFIMPRAAPRYSSAKNKAGRNPNSSPSRVAYVGVMESVPLRIPAALEITTPKISARSFRERPFCSSKWFSSSGDSIWNLSRVPLGCRERSSALGRMVWLLRTIDSGGEELWRDPGGAQRGDTSQEDGFMVGKLYDNVQMPAKSFDIAAQRGQ